MPENMSLSAFQCSSTSAIGLPPSGLYRTSVRPTFAPRTSRKHNSLSCPLRGSMELLCQLHGRWFRPLRRRMKRIRSKDIAGLRSTIRVRFTPSSAARTFPAAETSADVAFVDAIESIALRTTASCASTRSSAPANDGLDALRCAARRSMAAMSERAFASARSARSRRVNSPASTRNALLPLPLVAVRPHRASKRTAPSGTGSIA